MTFNNYIQKYSLPILIFIMIFIVLVLLVSNIDNGEKPNKPEKFADLPVSEIIILNNKKPKTTATIDVSKKLCDSNGVCLGDLIFDY
jgi:hypothetical protein